MLIRKHFYLKILTNVTFTITVEHVFFRTESTDILSCITGVQELFISVSIPSIKLSYAYAHMEKILTI